MDIFLIQRQKLGQLLKKAIKVKSSILIKIKGLEIFSSLLLIYFIVYQSYLIWVPDTPITQASKFNSYMLIGVGIVIGVLLDIILSYIKFKMHKYRNEFSSRYNEKR